MTRSISRTDRQNRLDRLDRIASRLDTRFRIPVIGVRFGWDSVIGLIPGLGDLVTAVPGIFMIYEGAQIGVRRRVLARMGLNTALDFFIGGVPVVGDVFDLFFKSHKRNMALIRAEVARPGGPGRRPHNPAGFPGSRGAVHRS